MEAIGATPSPEIKGRDPVGGKPSARDREVPERGHQAQESKKSAAQEDRQRIERIAQMLKDSVRHSQTKLQINVDPGTGSIAVKVISKEDGSVIREIPPEELLALASKMKKMMGLLFDTEV